MNYGEHSSAHNRPLMEGPGDSQHRHCDCHFVSIRFEAQKDDSGARLVNTEAGERTQVY